jgi:outer membrane autotransporter protein
LPAASAVAQSDPSLFIAGGRLRGAYEFAFENWYVRPYGDLDLIYTNMPGFQESGPVGTALNVRGNSKTSVAISPMVEFGGRLALDEKTTIRPFAAIGISFLPNNTRHVDASFVGASSASGTFRSFMKAPGVLGNLDLGVQVYCANGFEVKAEYGIKAGGTFLSQSASARVAYHF